MNIFEAVGVFLLMVASPFLGFLLVPDPPPKRGDYADRKGKFFFLKYAFIWLSLKLKRYRHQPRNIDEKPQTLPANCPKAVDAVYFAGANNAGQFLVASAARRHGKIQTAFFLRIPGKGCFSHTLWPDTSFENHGEKGWQIPGMTIVNHSDEWTIEFDGFQLARLDSDNDVYPEKVCQRRKVDATISGTLTFKGRGQFFNADTDINDHLMARCIAMERWSSEMFATLKAQHQTHLEQMGHLTGELSIVEGTSTTFTHSESIDISCVRDHSYGSFRDWNEFHRYALNYLHTDEGVSLCCNFVCRPGLMSKVVFGFVIGPDGTRENVVETKNFEFFDFVDQDAPRFDKFRLEFVTDVGKTYKIDFLEGNPGFEDVDFPTFLIGDDREARIYENYVRGQLSTFDANGERIGKSCPLFGISEWMNEYWGPGTSRKPTYEKILK